MVGVREFENSESSVNKVGIATVICITGTSTVQQIQFMGFSKFSSVIISCTLYDPQGVAAVLGTVIDSLAHKALGETGILISLNRDFKVEQIFYLEDSFEIWRLGDNRKID